MSCSGFRWVIPWGTALFGWGVFTSETRFECGQPWVPIYGYSPESSCLDLFTKSVHVLCWSSYFSSQLVFTFTLVILRKYYRYSS